MSKINLKDLENCLKLLTEIFDNKEVAMEWLKFSHPSFGKPPLLVLADGNSKLVLKILMEMKINQVS